MEKDYEKIAKLIKLRREYAARVSPVEQAIEKERKGYSKEDQEYMAGEWLSRRLDSGLFSLQVSTVAFICFYSMLPVLMIMKSRPLMSFWHG
jgi:beta-catenin-like protein 1